MSDYFTNLLDKSFNEVTVVRPQPISLYATSAVSQGLNQGDLDTNDHSFEAWRHTPTQAQPMAATTTHTQPNLPPTQLDSPPIGPSVPSQLPTVQISSPLRPSLQISTPPPPAAHSVNAVTHETQTLNIPKVIYEAITSPSVHPSISPSPTLTELTTKNTMPPPKDWPIPQIIDEQGLMNRLRAELNNQTQPLLPSVLPIPPAQSTPKLVASSPMEMNDLGDKTAPPERMRPDNITTPATHPLPIPTQQEVDENILFARLRTSFANTMPMTDAPVNPSASDLPIFPALPQREIITHIREIIHEQPINHHIVHEVEATVSSKPAAPLQKTAEAVFKPQTAVHLPAAMVQPRIQSKALTPPSLPQMPASTAPAPTIYVTIGRLEVKASVAQTTSQVNKSQRGPNLTLEAYLKQRAGGER